MTIDLRHDGRASVGGLRSCGSATACPLCSAAVWAERAADLAHILAAAHAEGLAAVFVTVTMRHTRDDELAKLWNAMTPALKAVTGERCKPVRDWREEHTVRGTVRRVECTWGENGAHLHTHELWLLEEQPDEKALNDLRRKLHTGWCNALPEGIRPSEEHGVDVALLDISSAERAAAEYLTAAGSWGSAEKVAEQAKRVAAEFSDASRKTARHGNRTMWEVLREAVGGDKFSAAIWRTWEMTAKGRQVWRVSPALKLLAQEHAERATEEHPEPVALATLSESEWQTVCRKHDPAQLLDDAEAAYRCSIQDGCIRDEALCDAALAVLLLLDDWGIKKKVIKPPGTS